MFGAVAGQLPDALWVVMAWALSSVAALWLFVAAADRLGRR